ncbi:similar to Saccharomyces cerevisiae YCL031C RRP7 Essential protein involved in rRNA processing and ribosome biogenesis [Maudiozyma saulgeensis]|uniref:Similar to Saccharomyces cerevisiae YCL031C RRP7 Essential protein involved in rRNA processing and ribosome biogenesis n=1 Tax=Maudiozyma saulgeensis TaxID=1789683 RepID=A0A1X7R3Q6_9SACH|nr:similar to Saccharomyces cerevisiae YCL031C RRP7 Essential protein involved in rRNA processing and ribosome biogenesis [Kazachstania saulgeensis]
MSDTEQKTKRVTTMKNGFIVIPFKLPSFDVLPSKHSCYHYLFAKKHESNNENEQNCLFVMNLPLLTNLDSIKSITSQICEKYDTVSHIENLMYNDEFGLNEVDLSVLTSDLMAENQDIIEKRFTPRNTALVKFVDKSSLNNCLNALKKYSTASKSDIFEWKYNSPSIETFINFYRPLDVEYLKEDVHTHLSLFEQREQQAQEDVQSSIVDEDGFTLVVGKNTKNLNSIRKKILNRNPLLKNDSAGVTKPTTAVDKKAKQDFYRFQVRERKKQEINQLLSKFKEDQERIKVMKEKRKFNPYKNSL